jgi:hypothetical protein
MEFLKTIIKKFGFINQTKSQKIQMKKESEFVARINNFYFLSILCLLNYLNLILLSILLFIILALILSKPLYPLVSSLLFLNLTWTRSNYQILNFSSITIPRITRLNLLLYINWTIILIICSNKTQFFEQKSEKFSYKYYFNIV